MIHSLARLALIPIIAVAIAQPVAGQLAEPSVSGMGAVTIERPAERMRMQVELSATAPTLKDALAALKDRQQAAQLQLESLGADKATIKFSDVAVADERGSDRRAEMERMLRSRLAGRKGANAKAGAAFPTSHTVTVQLMADWPLAAKSPEETLLAVHDIQDKVRKADLAGLTEKKELTPEEQELAEEMAGMNDRFGDDEERPGEPRFAFVAKLSEADREQALAEAFGKAKSQAARTAKAAGAELGGVLRVADLSAGADAGEMMGGYYGGDYYGYNRYAAQMRRQAFFSRQISDEESFAPQPGAVSFQLGVNAVFRLK